MRSSASFAALTILALSAVPSGGAHAADIRYGLGNASFEVGLQGWACYTRGVNYPVDVHIVGLDPQPVWAEVTNAPHGRRVLRFDAPDGCSFHIFSRAFSAQPGTMRLSFYARTDVALRVGVVDAGKERNNALAEVAVEPRASWKRFVQDVTVPEGTSHVAIAVGGRGPGWLELDDFRLGAPDGREGPQVEMGLVAQPAQVVFEDQPVTIVARIFAEADLRGAAVRYWVEDAWGQQLMDGKTAAQIKAGRLSEVKLP
ncbi:MAG: hypothetical protein N2512_15735, partial [Armatimonadetes bacterium]|nr:hypothetical protein [Armatimonadota bacterium]